MAVVAVGASLAGLRAVEALRRDGYDGEVIAIGAEPHPPYDRPPLSKQVLTGVVEPGATTLPPAPDVGVEWILGRAAVALDLDARRVTLAGGDSVGYDRLIIATGAHPRRLALPGDSGAGDSPGGDGDRAGGGLAGVHELRTLDDAVALRAALGTGPRVAVIGAGFIGAEVASSCHALGLDVTVIEALPVPLRGPLGDEMGRVCAGLHARAGVRLRTGEAVDGLVGTERVEGVRLAGGDVVAADVVVVGVGVTPTTGWLEGSGVDVADGVRCDSRCRVLASGRPLPDVVAAGDVARWDHPEWGAVRLEHWTNAVEQAEAAARTLRDGDGAPPYTPVPYFWSDQYKVKIQFVGRALPGDDVQVLEGSVDEQRFVAGYGRDGRLVAALGFRRPARVMAYQRMIADGASWPVATD